MIAIAGGAARGALFDYTRRTRRSPRSGVRAYGFALDDDGDSLGAGEVAGADFEDASTSASPSSIFVITG